MRNIALLVGARPNYMKVFPIWRTLKRDNTFAPLLIHTGQHYDHAMSQSFFDDLGLPDPDVFLGVGSGTHAEQTARVMIALEPVMQARKPDWLVVVGDVNSTLAGALVATKLGILVAHVEAGLRSFDRTMPEEINRLLTDAISDLLFTSCRDADENLRRDGVAADKIHFVGNVMIDTLVTLLPQAERSDVLARLDLTPCRYVAVTLHRPANVDRPDNLQPILEQLAALTEKMPVVFPMHPRTRKNIETQGLEQAARRLTLIKPLGYLDFLRLESQAALVITDSGGIQEETTYLGVPCLTVRPNTERPITITQGTNRLVDLRARNLMEQAMGAMENRRARTQIELWDGKSAERIVQVLQRVN